MQRLALLCAAVSSALGREFTISSGWEFWDGMDPVAFSPVLGTYGAIESYDFETSGCYAGSRCLKFTETVPLSGTPQVYLAYITNLVPGDVVYASYWGKGSGSTTKTRLWAHYTVDDHTDYSNSGYGPDSYVGLDGVWGKSEHTWTVPDGETGMVIEARIYAYDGGYGDSPDVWVDDLTVTIISETGLVATAPAYETYFTDPGPVLGTYTYDGSAGGADNVQVEQVSEGCYSYPSCYKATEDPLEGSPQVWIASVYNLSPYDHVYAQLWVKGAGSTTKSRLWASYFEGEITNYAASHPEGGPNEYKGEDGLWGLSSYTWPITHGHTGLLIQARVYAYDMAYNSVLIDNLLISTNSTTAYVLMAPKTAAPPAPPLDGMERICRCFANGAENEPYCEVENEFDTLDSCEATDACHWGPLEIPACNDYWPRDGPVHTAITSRLEPRVCQCFANERQYEPYCEGRAGVTFADADACNADVNCHWGPAEFAMCNENWPQDTPQEEHICRCFANGAENEPFCEEENDFTDAESCTADNRCHWGPHEVPACNPDWPRDSPFPVANLAVKAKLLNQLTQGGGPNFDGPGAGETKCFETCTHASDTDCDDGGDGSEYSLCDIGTDCVDCGPRLALPPPPSPPLPTPARPIWYGSTVCLESCVHTADGDCDDGGPGAEYVLCEWGTDCIDCGSRSALPPPPPPLPPGCTSEHEVDHRCGPEYDDAVCDEGRCCSEHEWCGSSTDHCNANSYEEYSDGNCNPGGDDGDCVSEQDTGHRCGPNYDDAVCDEGRCCSQHEWCGDSADHCNDNSLVLHSDGNGCASDSACASEGDVGHRCGPDYDDANCGEGRCCSEHEWCGDSTDHCNANSYAEYSDGNCPLDDATRRALHARAPAANSTRATDASALEEAAKKAVDAEEAEKEEAGAREIEGLKEWQDEKRHQSKVAEEKLRRHESKRKEEERRAEEDKVKLAAKRREEKKKRKEASKADIDLSSLSPVNSTEGTALASEAASGNYSTAQLKFRAKFSKYFS